MSDWKIYNWGKFVQIYLMATQKVRVWRFLG